MNLDALDDVARLDPQSALRDVLSTWEQWQGAAGMDVSVALHPDVQAVLVVGMGGSGIAGDVAAVVGEGLGVPVLVHKGYGVPGWVSLAHVGHRRVAFRRHRGNARRVDRRAGPRSATRRGHFPVDRSASWSTPWARSPTSPRVGSRDTTSGGLPGGVLRLLGADDGLGEAAEVTRDIADGCGPGSSHRSQRRQARGRARGRGWDYAGVGLAGSGRGRGLSARLPS